MHFLLLENRIRPCCALPAPLSTLHYFVIIEFNVDDPILRDRLHRHALEIDRHPPLQLVRALVQDLDALMEGDIGVVVFVEDGETVVSVFEFMSALMDGPHDISRRLS